MPESLAEQEKSGQPFRFQLVKSEIAAGVATLTLNRPDAMNALNPELVAQFTQAFDEAAARGDVRAIVIAGAGKAFVAGADIRFFVRQMQKQDLGPVRAFTEGGQSLLRRMEECPKPVLAKLDGLSLGGGSELALACQAIVATERGSLGFPETGIGIYPGLGGTQRTTRRIGVGLAKYLILTGEPISAADAIAIGLIDEMVPATEIDAALARRAAAPRAEHVPPGDLPEPWRTRAEFFARTRVDAILAGRSETGGNADLERAVEKVRRKAPIALRLAEQLIEEGARTTLAEGLAMELAHLEEIFRTEDAREALSSLVSGRPEFHGR